MTTTRREFLRNSGLATLAALEAGAMFSPHAAMAASPNPGPSAFGSMFGLPAFAPDSDPNVTVANLATLAASMADTGNIPNPTGNGAIFTYFGQFVDHDLTRDDTPLPFPPFASINPTGISNVRQFSLNLDSVYGGGPTVSPGIYAADGIHLNAPVNINGVPDLPRDSNGVAIIGDGRNDENELVSQVHHAFLLFHNNVVDQLGLTTLPDAIEVVTRYHQWLVLHELLPEIIGQPAVDGFVNGTTPSFYKPGNPNAPMTPVEWAVAAYRLHTMVRTGYKLNPTDGGHKIFDGTDNGLHGGRPLPAGRSIDFRMFVDEIKAPVGPFQVYDAFDTHISSPGLYEIPIGGPSGAEPTGLAILPLRNLIRGLSYGLPSGQDVATMMGVTPIAPTEAIDPTLVPGFTTGTPLWYYVMKEAETVGKRDSLGPVGGRIVGDVFTGLMKADPNGLLHDNSPKNGGFTPAPPIAAKPGTFTFGDLITFAGLA
jgi:hypothetical protein